MHAEIDVSALNTLSMREKQGTHSSRNQGLPVLCQHHQCRVAGAWSPMISNTLGRGHKGSVHVVLP